MPRKVIPEEKGLGILDEKGYRLFRHPMDVKGFFRKYRSIVYNILIVIFLILPWIKINGFQSILIDIPNRQFSFFGLHLWGHDAPLIFFVLAILTIGLAYLTAVYGRVWCGWGCPQTVFIDGVFRKIDAWVEGNHVQRVMLDKAPWSVGKAYKKSVKWFLYFIVSFLISHSFLAYFVGSSEVIEMIMQPPFSNWNSFLIVFSICALIMFDFGWFREQFCIIMCPYGRFQSVLMDKHSLAILYDDERGEPRKAKDVPKDQQGDCIDCFKCVKVCPTGIDIRDGIQMECIACTACIDACDDVMRKIKKPEGLIRYGTEYEFETGKKSKTSWRSSIYLTLIAILTVALSVIIYLRKPIEYSLIRAIESPYTINKLASGEEQIINHYRVNLRNQKFKDVKVALQVLDGNSKVEMVSPTFPVDLKPGEKKTQHVFFKFPKAITKGSGAKKLKVELKVTGENISDQWNEEISLVGPTL